MGNLILKELRELRWALIVGTIVLSIMAIFSAWSYRIIPLLDDIIIQHLGPQIAEEIASISANYTYYLWSQWQPKNLLQIGTIIALILAAPAVAGEVNRGSIAYLTSLPISRSKILMSKAVAGIITLSVTIWISTLLMLVLGNILEPPILWGRLLAATALTNLGLISIYSIGLVFSAMGSDAVKSGALAASLAVGLSAFGLHRVTRVISPFWHMKGAAWFTWAEPFPWISVAILLILSGVSLAIANKIFIERQI